MRRFPQDIQDFGNLFVTLQERRHEADYEPTVRFTRSEVLSDIDLAESTMGKLSSSPVADRRAFSAYVLLKLRL